jgi:biopolymer transport protein ExbD
MNAAQVRAKARMAMKRRAELIEDDEREAGELNLIPYLDITVNLMLFLLASVSVGFILGHINTTLPDSAPDSAVGANDPNQAPNDQDLQLVVSVTRKEIIVWSLSELVGSAAEPHAVFECQDPAVLADPKEEILCPVDKYDYTALNSSLLDVVKARQDAGWMDPKTRPVDSKQVILQFDARLPYDMVIRVMDHVRQVVPAADNLDNIDDPEHGLTAKPNVGLELFPDIHFASGFE